MSDSSPRVANPIPPVIAVGGSAGSLPAVQQLLGTLPAWLSATVVVVQHMAPATEYVSMLTELLHDHCRWPVQWAEPGAVMMRSRVYVAPQDHHTQLGGDGCFHITRAETRPRPSIDGLFASVARACGERCIGIVLSGRLEDGAQGARAVAAAGGTVVVQEPQSALHRDMPQAVLRLGIGALVLPPARMADAIAAQLLMVGGRSWFRVSGDSAYIGTVAPP